MRPQKKWGFLRHGRRFPECPETRRKGRTAENWEPLRGVFLSPAALPSPPLTPGDAAAVPVSQMMHPRLRQEPRHRLPAQLGTGPSLTLKGGMVIEGWTRPMGTCVLLLGCGGQDVGLLCAAAWTHTGVFPESLAAAPGGCALHDCHSSVAMEMPQPQSGVLRPLCVPAGSLYVGPRSRERTGHQWGSAPPTPGAGL